jgi:hypothetical protein
VRYAPDPSAGGSATGPARGAATADAGTPRHMSVSHQTVTLARGKHASPAGGACVMELASMLAGEPFTDRPASVCPVIAAFLRSYNDAIDDRRRQDLYRYASAAVGSRASAEVTRRRAERCLDELRALRRWPFGTLVAPRTLPDSPAAMERIAGRLARELHRSGIGSHARAQRIVDVLLAMGPGPADHGQPAVTRVSGSGRSRAGAAAR